MDENINSAYHTLKQLCDYFLLPEEVYNMFMSNMVTEFYDILNNFEKYKIVKREDLLKFITTQNAGITYESFSVKGINNDTLLLPFNDDRNKFNEFVSKYNAIPVLGGDTTNTHYHDNKIFILSEWGKDIQEEVISLQLGKYSLEFLKLTTANIQELKSEIFNCAIETEYNTDILFQRILLEAIKLDATDLHFETVHVDLKVHYPIRYRKSGSMYPLELFQLDSKLNEMLISKLVNDKTNSNSLDLSQSAGVTTVADDIFNNGKVELRISANKVKDGYHCVIRIQQKTTVSLKINELGFDEAVQDDLEYLANKKSGITLFTGAIRTGKNTSAFALGNIMLQKPITIVGYDSPVEVLMPFPQIDYYNSQERLLDYVKSAKKQDVNVAFLNEIPSKDVAFAVQDLANSSVHVVTTMHIDRIWHLPYKLYEYYGENYKNIISQINGVCNQKMFPVLCPHCQTQALVGDIVNERKKDLLRKYNVDIYYQPGCCKECNDERTNTHGYIPGKNQPFVERLIFTEDLLSKLLKCNEPWEMEMVLKQEVKELKQDLESVITTKIAQGVLSIDALDDIL